MQPPRIAEHSNEQVYLDWRRQSQPAARRNRSAAAGPKPSRSECSPAPPPQAPADSARPRAPPSASSPQRPSSSSWRTTSALPRCRRNRSFSQSPCSPRSFSRFGFLKGRQPPACKYRLTVVRLTPNSAAIRFDPHPAALSRSIAAPPLRLNHLLSPRFFRPRTDYQESSVCCVIVHQNPLLADAKGVSSSWRQGVSFPCRPTWAKIADANSPHAVGAILYEMPIHGKDAAPPQERVQLVLRAAGIMVCTALGRF